MGIPIGIPHLLELLADGVEFLPRVRHLEARLLEEVLAVGRHEHAVVLGHRAPHALDVRPLVRGRDGLAVLLLEPGDHVGDVHELRLVEPREVHAHLDQVVAGLGLDLGGVLGLLWAHVGDVVDLELDARVLGEALPDLGQLLVGGGGEVVPAEIRDLALLAARGRDAGGQDAGKSGGGGQEVAAGDWFHRFLLMDGTLPDALRLQTAGRPRRPLAWSIESVEGVSMSLIQEHQSPESGTAGLRGLGGV